MTAEAIVSVGCGRSVWASTAATLLPALLLVALASATVGGELPAVVPAIAWALAAAWLLMRVWRRRARRARVRLHERLSDMERAWWDAARAGSSVSAAFAWRLRSFATCALDCSEVLDRLEKIGSPAEGWQGPPPIPAELRPGRERPGPAGLWRRFDHCYETARLLLHPADGCFALGVAAGELADWIEEHKPDMPVQGDTYAGPEAGMVHALAAPCLAGVTSRHCHRQEGIVRIATGQLAERIERDGSERQRTMLALAFALAGEPALEVAVSELLELEDTDLCHALEAVALARGLRRVYPRQRPELLWLQAALADSGAHAETVESEEKGADE
jgi:hypothetical protein